ncbi:PAS domain-containing sensor histidine kinase [Candidatus Palauibacter sp.]|uniref:PAS domain-containing sensor histidine kinase n=1 Tax=Candidatus Palauibacter sp. TaxID=3101350 RepID=UPI003B02510C
MLDQGDYTAVFDASPDAMLVVDAEGVIRDLNRQAVTMFGWSREELEGRKVERLIPDASRVRHRRHRARYGEAPQPRPMGEGLELEALRRDGTTIPVEISLSPSRLGRGRDHVICAVRDISAWRRMRRLSGMMIAAAENERKHLSRELHDEFLQSLVALKIRVKLLADEKDHGERERARARVAEDIAGTILGVKRMIRGLLPPELDRQGISAALGSIFRDVEDVYGFTVHARLERVDGRLDPVAAVALYRIVQEAVTNAAQHAEVSEAVVTLGAANGAVRATVRDEGRGFDLPDSEALGGDAFFGIAGMHERAALVGGTLAVQTSPGRGTTVRASVPARGWEPKKE